MAREISDSKYINKTGGSDSAAGLNSTPSAGRVHIGFFGKRNAGKSSVVNGVTGQSLSIVSEVKGTTTDPVHKAMELLPLGPVVIIDTPGIDDDGIVGQKRVEKTYDMLAKTDIAVLVIDGTIGIAAEDEKLIEAFQKKKIPFIVVFNKADLTADLKAGLKTGLTANLKADSKTDSDTDSKEKVSSSPGDLSFPYLEVSAATGDGIFQLKEKIASLAKPVLIKKKLIGDKLSESDIVILVTPIDQSAPKGRLILPQVQTIRDILDTHAVSMVTQTEQLTACLSMLKNPPALVVTDSQDFHRVKEMIPETVKLTSFSILMARFKGILDTAAAGAHALSQLQDGDTVLISEGCTHHRQCEDIGTVKLPGWIQNYTGKKLNFAFTSGGEFPRSESQLKAYAMVVHCGGCMLNEREMLYRMELTRQAGIPFTNYGILIAHINGILDRSLEIFYE